jgi:hypothetical protein
LARSTATGAPHPPDSPLTPNLLSALQVVPKPSTSPQIAAAAGFFMLMEGSAQKEKIFAQLS